MTDTLPNVTYSEASHQLRLDGKIIPTATSVVGMLNKPGLSWGASKETALYAVHHQDEWMHLDPTDAYHKLRKHHAGVWGEKAARGTTVHALALGWAQGNEVDVPAECSPYMDALERFYLEVDPQWVQSERNILHLDPGGEYGGQFDYIRWDRLTEDLVCGDFKTGKRYPIDTTVQLAGYRFADHMATYENNRLVKLEPMVPVHRCEVLYLHDDGTYELLTVPADEGAWDIFLRLRATWGWLRDMDRWEKQHPEPERVSA